MLRKKFTLLFITFVFAILAFLSVNSDKFTEVKDKEEKFLLSGVNRGNLSGITKIEIDSEKNKVSLFNQDGTWKVKERGGYSADRGKISKIVNELSLSTLKEKKTSDSENYEKIGLDSKNSVRVRFCSGAEDTLADLYLGKYSSYSNGTYVRFEGDDQTWLTSNYISVDKSPEQWLENKLFSVEEDRVRFIKIERPGEKSLIIKKDNFGKRDFYIKGLNKNKEKILSDKVNSVASAMENFTFKDVMSLSEIPFTDNKNVTKFTLRTFDGFEIKALLTEKNGKKWASFKAVFRNDLIKRQYIEDSITEAENQLSDISGKSSDEKSELSESKSDLKVSTAGTEIKAAGSEDTQGKSLDEKSELSESKSDLKVNTEEGTEAELAISDNQSQLKTKDSEDKVMKFVNEVKKQVEKLSSQLSGRAFEISDSDYKKLTTSLDSLLKKDIKD